MLRGTHPNTKKVTIHRIVKQNARDRRETVFYVRTLEDNDNKLSLCEKADSKKPYQIIGKITIDYIVWKCANGCTHNQKISNLGDLINSHQVKKVKKANKQRRYLKKFQRSKASTR